jgi:carbonic anhydrase
MGTSRPISSQIPISLTSNCQSLTIQTESKKWERHLKTAKKALAELQAGNKRFVAGKNASDGAAMKTRRNEVAAAQTPFAVILGCSDSRVPAEIVFDQGLGDLFVIRVAGNIVAPSQIGSVEFAVSQFDTRLVVVLGHTQCGAICATVEDLKRSNDQASRNIESIVNRIRPVVEPFRDTELWHDTDALVDAAVRANVRASANQLRHGSQILEDLIEHHNLLIVCAEYNLDTGVVDFF